MLDDLMTSMAKERFRASPEQFLKRVADGIINKPLYTSTSTAAATETKLDIPALESVYNSFFHIDQEKLLNQESIYDRVQKNVTNRLMGMDIFESPTLVIQTQKRKHKKKRFNKKWLKKYGYTMRPDPKIIIFDDKIIGHPKTIKRLIAQVNPYKIPYKFL